MTIFERFNQILAVSSVHIQKKIWRVFGCKFKLQNWNRIVFSDCLVLLIGIFVCVVICNVPIAWKYLLLTEFEVGTVSYRPSFFHFIYGPSAKHEGYELKVGNTFEARTAAGSELFSCLTCLHTTTFILLSIRERPQACHAKCSRLLSLPQKRRLLKLFNETGVSGRTIEYGPQNWPIEAHILTKGYNIIH